MTTGRAASASSATASRAGSSCACPARTSTRTWRWRRWSPPACTGSTTALELEPPLEGNAYVADKPHVPRTLSAARDLFASSEVAKSAFGEEVVEHYLNMARVELEAFESAVTDWERVRGFERL